MSGFVEKMVERYNNSREKYNFFDVNCWWDYTDDRTFHGIGSFKQLRRELESYYIKKAVVTSAECLKYDPLKANEKLASLIREYKQLSGCMVLVPELTFSGRNVRDYIDKKLEQGFVCVRMFPKKLRHSMKDWLVGDILKYLEFRKIPLILWHNEVSWDFIEGLSRQYSKLPIIIEGNDVKLLYHNRNYVPLLERYENIYLETHNIVLFSELDHLANEINKEKLIFGTYFPYNTPNATMLAIAEGRMTEEAKYLIVGNNLQKIISNIK